MPLPISLIECQRQFFLLPSFLEHEFPEHRGTSIHTWNTRYTFHWRSLLQDSAGMTIRFFGCQPDNSVKTKAIQDQKQMGKLVWENRNYDQLNKCHDRFECCCVATRRQVRTNLKTTWIPIRNAQLWLYNTIGSDDCFGSPKRSNKQQWFAWAQYIGDLTQNQITEIACKQATRWDIGRKFQK